MIRYCVWLLPLALAASEIVSFPSGGKTLQGVLYKPEGAGPFPAVVFNHGSGRDYARQFEALGAVYNRHGWVFFAPYRRGHGLSKDAGPYIVDEMNASAKTGGRAARSATMVRILETDHLQDQLAALEWLKKTGFVQVNRVAVAGNSFGGIQTVLGAEHGSYCAAIDSAGAAQTWASSPDVRALMTRSVQHARVPIFFLQAENDWDLGPSRTLSEAAKKAGKPYQVKIYPAYGKTKEDGHAFGYFGSAIWGEDVFRFLNEHCGK
jgi:dienelactone hydrolase